MADTMGKVLYCFFYKKYDLDIEKVKEKINNENNNCVILFIDLTDSETNISTTRFNKDVSRAIESRIPKDIKISKIYIIFHDEYKASNEVYRENTKLKIWEKGIDSYFLFYTQSTSLKTTSQNILYLYKEIEQSSDNNTDMCVELEKRINSILNSARLEKKTLWLETLIIKMNDIILAILVYLQSIRHTKDGKKEYWSSLNQNFQKIYNSLRLPSIDRDSELNKQIKEFKDDLGRTIGNILKEEEVENPQKNQNIEKAIYELSKKMVDLSELARKLERERYSKSH